MKTKKTDIALSREQLDRQFQRLKREIIEPPAGGWIRNIRQGLGISTSQLGKRLGITRQGVHHLEKQEAHGTISLSSLEKVADRLSCDLKVVFIPRKPLRQMVKEQALKIATKLVERTELHMKLEKQGTAESFRRQRIKELSEELVRENDKRLWDE